MNATHARAALPLALLFALGACGPGASPGDAGDGGDASDDVAAPGPDAPLDVQPASTAHCRYEPAAATGNAGGTVTEGEVSAGVAEGPLELPVGGGLGAFTGRAQFLGTAGAADRRVVEHAGWFNPSAGYEIRPWAKVLVLTVGDETLVLIKATGGAAETGVAYDVGAALGPQFVGKVIFGVDHSHSALGHTINNDVLAALGFGPFRPAMYRRMVDGLVRLARQALESRAPARIGYAHNPDFDPENRVSRDRREENNVLTGGQAVKDKNLYLLRVDTRDGQPLAMVPIFGMHGTILDADNNLATPDSSGAVERGLEESFDRRVLVMHFQGAGGDVSPGGTGGFDCGEQTRSRTKYCYNFAVAESVGRYAVDAVRGTWERAGMGMRERVQLETVTRSIPLGPDWRTFSVRDAGLSYAPFVPRRYPDRIIYDDAGNVAGPLIDEFNAPMGAGLCGSRGDGIYSRSSMPGTSGLRPYSSCQQVQLISMLFNNLLGVSPPALSQTNIACGVTRTAVTAARIGDFMMLTMPGEPVTLLTNRMREQSPFGPERTAVIGYANGHVGYLLSIEDWLLAGYEPSINLWGPLEGEYIGEQAVALGRLAATPQRENGEEAGAPRLSIPMTDPYPYPAADPTPMAGTVPSMVPSEVYARGFPTWTRAQPADRVPRLSSARFVWIGEDPLAGSPEVVLERETMPGSNTFAPVTRRSGRTVHDGDILVTWTPFPLRREGTNPRTHYWVAEWQAVSPWGMPMLEAIEDRPGVPLGRYRFAVRGTGYMVNSAPFEVTAGALQVMPTRMGTTVRAAARYHAPEGWRALSLTVAPNAPVPVSRGPVTVQLTLANGMTRMFADVPVSATGELSVDAGADAANARTVRVTDRFGNTGDGTL